MYIIITMKKRIDEMSKEEQYREYIKAHSNRDYDLAEEQYRRELNRREVERARYEKNEEKREKQQYRVERKRRKTDASEIINNSPQRRNKKKKFSIKRIFKRLITLVIVFMLIATGVFYFVTKNFDRHDMGDKSFGINPSAARELRNYRNILILGSDARKSQGYDGSRTDAIVILSINKKTGEMRLISLMRDSYLSMRGYGGGDYVLSKATHAHAYDGAMNTVSMLNRNLDLNIKEYVLFNWEAVSDMVDALGGVEIDVKEDELADLNQYGKETANNVGKDFVTISNSGKQTLNGAQAVTYCRIRKTSGGDAGRGERYKKVIQAVMVKSAKHPLALQKASKNAFPQIRTNMSQFKMGTASVILARAKMQSSVAWPYDYWGGVLRDGVWYAVPTTLEDNVEWLYKEAFGKPDYVSSQTVRNISSNIIEKSGKR